MNTKPIPAIISLTAGLVACIVNFVKHTEFGKFVLIVLIVLVAFYIFGCIVKLILDKAFNALSNPLSEMDEESEMDMDLIDDTVYDDEIMDIADSDSDFDDE